MHLNDLPASLPVIVMTTVSGTNCTLSWSLSSTSLPMKDSEDSIWSSFTNVTAIVISVSLGWNVTIKSLVM